MLENLPDVLGHALRGQRAGLDSTVYQRIDLRGGMAAIELKSLAFIDHGPLPERYTADGPGTSPPLQWSGVPGAAVALVLIVEDADAPTPQPLVHLILVGLGREDQALAEGALDNLEGDGAGYRLGRNSYLQAAWLPPDPPPGHGVHRYVFQLFALEADPDFSSTPGREEIVEAIQAHAIASGALIGTYERPDTSIRIESADAMPAVATPPAVA